MELYFLFAVLAIIVVVLMLNEDCVEGFWGGYGYPYYGYGYPYRYGYRPYYGGYYSPWYNYLYPSYWWPSLWY